MPPADNWLLAHNAPAMLQWTCNTNSDDQFLGCDSPRPSCRIAADIGFDASHSTALLRLRVPIWLKGHGNRKAALWIFIHPEHLHGLHKQDSDERVINAFVTHTQQCASDADVLSLRLQLAQPPRIVGPVGTTTLSPKTEASAEVLAALRSLSHANSVVLHVPKGTTKTTTLDAMCEYAGQGLLRPSTKEYALDALYRGAGGQDVGSLLANSVSVAHDSSESPPSYDELALTSPPARAGSSSIGKRPLANLGTTPPRKKRASVLRFAGISETLERRLSGIEAEVASLRGTVPTVPKLAPTPDTDRLDRLEDEVRSLRTEMQRLSDLLQEQSSDIEEAVTEKMEDYVDEKLDNVRDTDDQIDDKIDVRLLDLKEEFLEWVKDAVHDAVSEQLPEILETASFSLNVPR